MFVILLCVQKADVIYGGNIELVMLFSQGLIGGNFVNVCRILEALLKGE